MMDWKVICHVHSVLNMRKWDIQLSLLLLVMKQLRKCLERAPREQESVCVVPVRFWVSPSIRMGACGPTNSSFPWKAPQRFRAPVWSPDASACGSCMLTPSR